MSRLNFYLAYISIIYVLLFGCIGKDRTVFENKVIEGKAVIVKKTFDKEGNILTEELLDKDSIRNGYYKEFILGKLKDSGNYSSGQKEGQWNYWDLNGDVIRTENWFSGKQFGEQIDYYNQMKPDEQPRMYKYFFYNVEGQKIFESKFDIDNGLLNVNGSPIYCAYNSSDINAGDSYELMCFFGVPPGFKWDFSIKEKEKNNQSVLLEKSFSGDRSSNELLNLPFAKKYLHTKKYLKKGEYTWLLFLQIKSSSGQIIFKDSTELKVSVE